MIRKTTTSKEPPVKVIMNNPDALLNSGYRYNCPHCHKETVLDITPDTYDTLYCSQCGHAYKDKSYKESGIFVEYASEFFCPKCTNTFIISTDALHPELCVQNCPICGVKFIRPSLCDDCEHNSVCSKKTNSKTECTHYSTPRYNCMPTLSLSDTEIDTFQRYIELIDQTGSTDIAFKNKDWITIYDKLVNGNWSRYNKAKRDSLNT